MSLLEELAFRKNGATQVHAHEETSIWTKSTLFPKFVSNQVGAQMQDIEMRGPMRSPEGVSGTSELVLVQGNARDQHGTKYAEKSIFQNRSFRPQLITFMFPTTIIDPYITGFFYQAYGYKENVLFIIRGSQAFPFEPRVSETVFTSKAGSNNLIHGPHVLQSCCKAQIMISHHRDGLVPYIFCLNNK